MVTRPYRTCGACGTASIEVSPIHNDTVSATAAIIGTTTRVVSPRNANQSLRAGLADSSEPPSLFSLKPVPDDTHPKLLDKAERRVVGPSPPLLSTSNLHFVRANTHSYTSALNPRRLVVSSYGVIVGVPATINVQ